MYKIVLLYQEGSGDRKLLERIDEAKLTGEELAQIIRIAIPRIEKVELRWRLERIIKEE